MSHDSSVDSTDPSVQETAKTLERDLETEITDALIFNWFIGWPVILIASIILTIVISKKYVPDQFIDEIFHVPMVVQYFNGDFKTWNPKITTPPGLYYIGYIWSKLVQLSHLPIDPVGIANLRVLNTIAGTLVMPLILSPIFVLNPIGFWPVNLMLFPLLSTYYYLFYTDVWSAVIIVSSLSVGIALPFGEKRSVQVSALLGLLSVFMRQTNIIWNLFILVLIIERRAMIQKHFTDNFFNNCIKFIIQSVEDFYDFVLPFVINIFLFIGFLIYNRGITLGDKENHVAGLHFAQLFYCATFITVLSWPVWLSPYFLKDYFLRYRIGPLIIVIEYILILFFIRFFTIVHPFLLADNRHYTFYIWRKIINLRWYTKYFMTPIYHFSIYTVVNTFNTNAFYFKSTVELPFKNPADLPLKPTGISIWAWIGCTVLTIVPSPLFEPRYYIIPYIFFRVFSSVPYEAIFSTKESIKNVTLKRLILEMIWFILIDIFTISVFIFYKFPWDNESQLQRIIW